MGRFAKTLEVVANIAIVVVALFLGVILLQMFVLSPGNRSAEVQAGTEVSLPDVRWEASEQTLVLALAVDCRFCTESAPFYQRLVTETANSTDLQVIAVFPQEVDEARAYLDRLDVAITEVRQEPLSALSVVGTPTLILVNNRGEVTDSWVGKLPEEEEAALLARLRGRS